jgi:PadR family transcriptional regulator, regulatory protein PadR
MKQTSPNERYLFSGLIRLHVLHHAANEPIYGLEMIEELARHGYRLSAGTIYPILHGLEQRGLLVATERHLGRTRRRTYRATPAGRKALAAAKFRVRELFTELLEDLRVQRTQPSSVRSSRASGERPLRGAAPSARNDPKGK